jgi:hypothetical protein
LYFPRGAEDAQRVGTFGEVHTMKHLTDEQLALHYYGEGVEDSAVVSEHLHECEQCRTNLAQLGAVLGSVEIPVPERPENYEAIVWHNLLGYLPEAKAQTKWWQIGAAQRWVAFGAVAALIIAAFYLGRVTQVQQGPPIVAQAPQAPQIQKIPETQTPAEVPSGPAGTRPVATTAANKGQGHDRILLVALGDHLERSQMVLVELMNATPGESLDISSQRQVAEDLVSENRLYRQTAARAKDKSVTNLLDELERVLVDIAHEPSKVTGPELANIKQRIEAQGIVFKVRVVGSQMNQRKQQRQTVSGKTNVQRG